MIHNFLEFIRAVIVFINEDAGKEREWKRRAGHMIKLHFTLVQEHRL
jgi:hypothetical protein